MLNCHAVSCKSNKDGKCTLKDVTVNGLTRCENYEFDMKKAVKSTWEANKTCKNRNYNANEKLQKWMKNL